MRTSATLNQTLDSFSSIQVYKSYTIQLETLRVRSTAFFILLFRPLFHPFFFFSFITSHSVCFSFTLLSNYFDRFFFFFSFDYSFSQLFRPTFFEHDYTCFWTKVEKNTNFNLKFIQSVQGRSFSSNNSCIHISLL